MAPGRDVGGKRAGEIARGDGADEIAKRNPRPGRPGRGFCISAVSVAREDPDAAYLPEKESNAAL